MKLMKSISIFLVLVAGFAANCHAEYPEDTVTIVIPYGPGGGFDRAVRAFSPFFAQQLGNGVNVLPQNLPGAGGRRGSATVYRADPDGATLGIFNLPGFVLPSVLGEKVDYDLRKMSWIGRLELQNYVLLVAGSSDIHTIDDLKSQKTLSFLSTGYGSSVLAAAQITAKALGLMDKHPLFLTGYQGTADYLVALIRGDGNVALAPVSTADKYIEAGDLRALAVSGEESQLKGVPTFARAGYPSLTPLNVQRAIAGPPGMAPALLATLRAAFQRAVADPAFRSVAVKARMDLAPLDGDKTAVEVNQSYSFYENFKANLKNPNAF